jgi:Spy/CpxP family protein refolding chaperone
MKKIDRKFAYIVAFLAAMAVSTAVAQQGPGPQPGFAPHGGEPMQRLAEELGLDDAQAAEIQAIHEEARELHREELVRSFQNREAIREETNAAIMDLLDADQQERFLELLELRAERWGERHGPGMGPREPIGDGTCPNPDCPNPDCPNG